MAANPTHSDFASAFAVLSQQLACPACYGELRMEATCLTCTQCGRVYPIVDGIPVLIPVNSEQ